VPGHKSGMKLCLPRSVQRSSFMEAFKRINKQNVPSLYTD